jgi:hypothetical protein
MNSTERVWLAADYHFASVYSCRIPTSSISSATTTPAPGPGTVRMALIRVALEFYGIEYTRQTLFPAICQAPIWIRPPAEVAISNQLLRMYKGDKKSGNLQESVGYREVAHTSGQLTVYLQIPADLSQPFSKILENVSYWGQAHSLTCCVSVSHAEPDVTECARPLSSLEFTKPLRQFFTCVVSEFRDPQVGWEEVMPVVQPIASTAIRLQLFIWPLVITQQHSEGKLLQRQPFAPN